MNEIAKHKAYPPRKVKSPLPPPPAWLTEEPDVDIDFLMGKHNGNVELAYEEASDAYKPYRYRKSKAKAAQYLDHITMRLGQMLSAWREAERERINRRNILRDKRKALAIRLLREVENEEDHPHERAIIHGALTVIDSDSPTPDAADMLGMFNGLLDYRDFLSAALKYADDEAIRAGDDASAMNKWAERAHAIAVFMKGLQ